MEENEANAANVTEIETRIDRLAGKLRGLVPGTQAHTDVSEDIEDYYDRLVQIKQMRVNTLEELLQESKERESAAVERAVAHEQFAFVLAFICTTLALAIVETIYPGDISIPLSILIHTSIHSTAGIAALCSTMTYLLSKHVLM